MVGTKDIMVHRLEVSGLPLLCFSLLNFPWLFFLLLLLILLFRLHLSLPTLSLSLSFSLGFRSTGFGTIFSFAAGLRSVGLHRFGGFQDGPKFG